MPNCTQETATHKIEFGRLGRRVVEGHFDGGSMTSDAGVMLLGTTDRKLGLMSVFMPPFVVDGHIYGGDRGKLSCIKADTGERMAELYSDAFVVRAAIVERVDVHPGRQRAVSVDAFDARSSAIDSG